MKYVLALVFVFSFLFSANPKDPIAKESVVSHGQKRTYYLFVPEKLDQSKPVSLIIMLHGSGRDGRVLVERWKDLANKEGIILAGPDASNPAAWQTPHDGPDFLRDVVEAIKAQYPINPRRVYLFGHSAGACFALGICLLESEYFAATAVSAGAMEPAKTPGLIGAAKRKIPIAIYVGTRDQFFPLEIVRKTRDALNAKEFSVQLTEITGHDHNYYSRSAEINSSAWEFLKNQELPADPQYVQYQFK